MKNITNNQLYFYFSIIFAISLFIIVIYNGIKDIIKSYKQSELEEKQRIEREDNFKRLEKLLNDNIIMSTPKDMEDSGIFQENWMEIYEIIHKIHNTLDI